MTRPDPASSLERIAAGLASGDIKEPVAILLVQSIMMDDAADPRRAAFIRETLNTAWRRIEQGKPPPDGG